MSDFEFTLNSFEETEAFAKCVAAVVVAPCSIALQGDLGAGKTTFARGFLHAFGHEGNVKSPTYTILEPYQLGDISVNHLDLYRLVDPEELEFIGAHELFTDNTINLIEWPEQGAGWLPEMDLWLKIVHIEDGRRLCLSANTPRGMSLLAKMEFNSKKS